MEEWRGAKKGGKRGDVVPDRVRRKPFQDKGKGKKGDQASFQRKRGGATKGKPLKKEMAMWEGAFVQARSLRRRKTAKKDGDLGKPPGKNGEETLRKDHRGAHGCGVKDAHQKKTGK